MKRPSVSAAQFFFYRVELFLAYLTLNASISGHFLTRSEGLFSSPRHDTWSYLSSWTFPSFPFMRCGNPGHAARIDKIIKSYYSYLYKYI